MWGSLLAKGLRPAHVQRAMEQLADKPGAANGFLAAMQALSKWGRAKGLLDYPLTDGVEAYRIEGGHRPWSDEQIACAHEHLTGDVRKGVMLMLYTGQRGSDMVRLGPTMIDEGGFDLGWRGQQKTGTRPWCPIFPELAKEMETWDKRPGPFVRNKQGGKCTRERFTKLYKEAKVELAKKGITTLEGTTFTACAPPHASGSNARASPTRSSPTWSACRSRWCSATRASRTSAPPARPCSRCWRSARWAPRTIRQRREGRIVKHWKTVKPDLLKSLSKM